MSVLVSLHRGYGLGDAVQMSSVLRHVAKYRPNWRVDYVADEGKHVVGRGIVDRTFAYGKLDPDTHYDAEVQILLYDTWANWGDRPNTRVSSCLHERFGLPWDHQCGRYVVNISEVASELVAWGMRTFVPGILQRGRGVVAVHYKGDSSPTKKNLSDEQADVVCQKIIALGRVPLLLDWRGTSPLGTNHGVCTTGGKSFSRTWGADAEMNCAVIQRCEAFVGIDSGPGKCASSTDVPTLITWTGHHPAPFHDPAPNTTHLVPEGYNRLEPVCNDRSVIAWFEDHYSVRHYEVDPVAEICNWLGEVLK